MKKTSSTGNLFHNEKNYMMRNSLRPFTTNRQTKFLKSSNYFPQNLSLSDIKSFNNNLSNYNYEHLLLNKSPKQLYDGLMSLKKRVNFLNEEISLAKSEQRKKDVQLNLKNKEIEEYLSDVKSSKYANQINIDKLKEINAISKYKHEYNKLKNILDGLKSKMKIMEIKIKKSRPNKVKQFNTSLEKRLKILISEYNILHQNNTAMNKQLEEMKNLPMIFTEKHKIIEQLKNRIDTQEKNVADLKKEIMLANDRKNFDKILLGRQKIKNITLNQKNQHLENEIENRKKVAEMRNKYKNKIKELNLKKEELENKYRNQERLLGSIKREIKLEEERRKADPLKLKAFNYSSISKLESNPLDSIDSKIILIQSLLDEALNKKLKYETLIQECIDKFKEIGYDYTELDKTIEENKDNDNAEKNNKEKEKQNIDEVSDNKKDNNESNNNNLEDEYNNIINNKENEEEKKDENENKNDNNNEINKDINQENQEIINDNTKHENKNIENQNTKENKTKESNNKELNEINNNKEENQEAKNEIKNIDIKENNEVLKQNENLQKLQEIINLNKEQNSSNKNNKLTNISIKEKNDSILEKNSLISNDEFSEFTFILIKNFEAKKINEELARQKIIIIPTKDKMEKKTFIEQMSFNIMKSIRCENKDSLEKTKKWLNSFLTMVDDDQKKVTENFLSLFKEVSIYNNEKELINSKKIKKYLFIKNPNFAKKLEQYKNKYIEFHEFKKFLEEENIELKDGYAQYLFYELKKYEDPQASIFDLKTDNLFKIFENEQNDSKMEEDSDIEISSEQYVNIVYNIGMRINKYMDENKTNLREILGDKIRCISEDEVPEKDRIEIVIIKDFVEKMKEIGVGINTEIEIYCLFNRYKISEEYDIISFNLLEKDLENFKLNKIEESDNQNQEENKDINHIEDIDRMNRIGADSETPEKNNLKVMEKVQEENEDNISNSENK